MAKVTKDTYLYWYELMLKCGALKNVQVCCRPAENTWIFHYWPGGGSADTMSALRADDRMITAYRDHGLAIAKGITCNQAMAVLGKATGSIKGKGGWMHFFSK